VDDVTPSAQIIWLFKDVPDAFANWESLRRKKPTEVPAGPPPIIATWRGLVVECNAVG
jgi:hypothetical protein